MGHIMQLKNSIFILFEFSLILLVHITFNSITYFCIGDLLGWKDSVIKELEKKHASERDLQLTILIDEGSEDLREAAREMTHDSRHRRLNDLKTSVENLNLDKKGRGPDGYIIDGYTKMFITKSASKTIYYSAHSLLQACITHILHMCKLIVQPAA